MKDAHYHSSSLSAGFYFGIAQLARFGEFGDMTDHLSPASLNLFIAARLRLGILLARWGLLSPVSEVKA
jgi:hypothetical protein